MVIRMATKTKQYNLYYKNTYDGGLWPICNKTTYKNINYSSLDSALLSAYSLCANDDDGSVSYVEIRDAGTNYEIGRVQYRRGGIYFNQYLRDAEKAYLLHKSNRKIKKELLKTFEYR